MNDLERFRGTLQYEKVDRAPFYEFMWPAWAETAERWAKEGGYVAGKTDFGCDKWVVEFSWFWPQPPFVREILAEDEEYATYVDPQGIVMREFKKNPQSSMPQFIRFPVETREDFRKYWRERMRPDLTQRIGPDWREKLRSYRKRDFPFVVIADRWGGGRGAPLHALLR
jgi:uroporphyrinogen decarboxylase